MFKIDLRLRDRHIFIENHWIFKRFLYFNFEKSFLKNGNLLAYRFLGQSITIENVIFSYKTAQSKASVNPVRPGLLMHILAQLCTHVHKDFSTHLSKKNRRNS